MNSSSRLRKTKDPCPVCKTHKDRCICQYIPQLDFKTRLCLIIHVQELKRTSNTGTLAVRSLVNSELRIRGTEGVPLDLTGLADDHPDYQSLLLYPSEEAQDLTPAFLKKFEKPIQLIVPDGNWRQAGKVHYRYPELRQIPRVKLQRPASNTPHLRAEHRDDGMSTLQAIALAYGVLEGPQAEDPLLKLYEAKLHSTLDGRGHLKAKQSGF
ncbi:MAG: tRNA-uridine aminocarboxypropyltransferase [Bdellovibrio sp.]|jgi:DTW domain-containing protein YfiP